MRRVSLLIMLQHFLLLLFLSPALKKKKKRQIGIGTVKTSGMFIKEICPLFSSFACLTKYDFSSFLILSII